VSLKGARKQVNEIFKVQVIYLGEEMRVVEVRSDGIESPVLMVLKREDQEQREDKARTEVRNNRNSTVEISVG
jgi:hypothetical protein